MATAIAGRYITAREIREEWERTNQLPRGDRLAARIGLGERVTKRDDALFERFGLPYLESHPDQWIAINEQGKVLLAESSLALNDLVSKFFEPGSFVKRRLNEARGHRMGL